MSCAILKISKGMHKVFQMYNLYTKYFNLKTFCMHLIMVRLDILYIAGVLNLWPVGHWAA